VICWSRGRADSMGGLRRAQLKKKKEAAAPHFNALLLPS